MHLYVLTRGQIDHMRNFINDLSAINLPFGAVGADGIRHFLQFSVRPIQLWEMCMAKEHLNLILNTISPNFNNIIGKQREVKMLEKLRFCFKAKKIPPLDLKGQQRFIVRNTGTGIYPFGIKEDKIFSEGDTYDDGKTPLPKELIGHEGI